jgi:hypothetical protein
MARRVPASLSNGTLLRGVGWLVGWLVGWSVGRSVGHEKSK